jgi:hypothetical protein
MAGILKQIAALALRKTAVVDDDFPEMMYNLDRALMRYTELAELPKIVCLCGSTRFQDTFIQANTDETSKGNIVLTVGSYVHYTPVPESIKEALDKLHLRKIDLADEILVLNVGGYIGESTRNEINYAKEQYKPVRYLEEHSVSVPS